MRIIGEIANAHGGSVKEAIILGKLAVEAGVDLVKFQVYFANELMVKDHKRFGHFSNQQFNQAEWNDIFDSVDQSSLKLAADVFGLTAFEVVLKNNIKTIKIHSSDLVNFHLLDQINRTFNGEVILSTGGATGLEIVNALNKLENVKKITLMHGFQAYPTATDTMDLRRISWLKKIFGYRCNIGFQDHVAGNDPLAFTIPAAAYGAGASLIEKHLTLDRSAKGVDYYSSLEPKEMKVFVSQMRQISNAFNYTRLEMSENEREYRKSVIKQPVTKLQKNEDELFEKDEIEYLRINDAKSKSLNMDQLVKRKLNQRLLSQAAIVRNRLNNCTVACIIVRNKSTRLPNKAFTPIAGQVPLEHLIDRVRRAKKINHIVICTSDQSFDDPVEKCARKKFVEFVRGSELNVLARMQFASTKKNADTILRITADDILFCAEQVDEAIDQHICTNSDYTDMKSMPGGTEAEIFDAQVLTFLNNYIKSGDSTEYLTNYISHNKLFFETTSYLFNGRKTHNLNLTLDTMDDRNRIEHVFRALSRKNKIKDYTIYDILETASKINLPKKNINIEKKSQPIDYNIYLGN